MPLVQASRIAKENTVRIWAHVLNVRESYRFGTQIKRNALNVTKVIRVQTDKPAKTVFAEHAATIRSVVQANIAKPMAVVIHAAVQRLIGMQQRDNVLPAWKTAIVPAQHPIVTQVPVFVKNAVPIRSAAQANIAKPMAVVVHAAVQHLAGTAVPKSAKRVRQARLIGV